MKRFHLMIGLLLTLTLCACGKSRLAVIVGTMQKECPIDMGQVTMDRVEYDNNTVSMYYTSDLINIEAAKEHSADFRSNMLESYATNSEKGFKILIDALVDAGADLKVVFSNSEGETFEMLFSADELKNNQPNGEGDPEAMLQITVKNTNLQCPMTIDEGMILREAVLTPSTFIYYYLCDEEMYSIDELNENIDLVRDSTIEELMSDSDQLIAELLQELQATHRNLVYVYEGTTTGKTCSIEISVDELLNN